MKKKKSLKILSKKDTSKVKGGFIIAEDALILRPTSKDIVIEDHIVL